MVRAGSWCLNGVLLWAEVVLSELWVAKSSSSVSGSWCEWQLVLQRVAESRQFQCEWQLV